MDPFNTAEDESKDSDKNASKDQMKMNEDEPQRPDNIKGDPNKTSDDDEAGMHYMKTTARSMLTFTW